MLPLLLAKPKLLLVGCAVAAALTAIATLAWGVQTYRLAAERAAHAETRTSLEREASKAREALAANARFAQTIATQNQAMASLKQKADARQAQATTVVRKMLEKPAKLPDGAGPAILNEFMGGVFSQ